MELSPATKKKNIQISSLFDRADLCGRFTPNKNPPACREDGGGQREDMGVKLDSSALHRYTRSLHQKCSENAISAMRPWIRP